MPESDGNKLMIFEKKISGIIFELKKNKTNMITEEGQTEKLLLY